MHEMHPRHLERERERERQMETRPWDGCLFSDSEPNQTQEGFIVYQEGLKEAPNIDIITPLNN